MYDRCRGRRRPGNAQPHLFHPTHRRHGTPAYRDELPRIDVGLARWLVERGVVLLGVEPPSVADVNSPEELTAVHRVLLSGGVIVVEGLADLDQITSEVFELIVLPLRVRGGDGSPVRAVAVEETETIEEAVEDMVVSDQEIHYKEPQPVYEKHYELFLDLYDNLKKTYEKAATS